MTQQIRAADWTTEKRCSIGREDLWDLQKILAGEKASLRKTYKTQTEANDKVWSLNSGTEKASETLAVLFERLKQVKSDLADVDEEMDEEMDEAMDEAMEKVKEAHTFSEIAMRAASDT